MVAVFPEGTTGDGRELLPFHANLLQAADRHRDAGAAGGAALHRAGLGPSARRSVGSGDTTLVQSVWRIACARAVQVRVTAAVGRAAARTPTGARWRATLREDIDGAASAARTATHASP